MTELKKAGITILFILICAGASLVLMNVFNVAAGKVKDYYHVEDPDREWVFDSKPWSGGWGDRRLDEPIVVDEYLPWFVDPFSGEDGSGKGFVDAVKKYGVYVILSVVFFFWYIRYKKKKRKDKEEGPPDPDQSRYAVISNEMQDSSEMAFTISEENLNVIRQLLFDWESHLNTLNRKRSHETIHEWFGRIKGPVEIIPIYEKVRYGGKPFTYEEVLLLKRFLK
ncbi:hypothetical protein AAEO50_07505 [Rossellomorea oryzaecorticis]|uniref:DUF4129 domain-containing protein n=1 Tax=Rossellomorea oryzaecorticis TaxID=1396505 RepID=A0ABU9K7Q4_9BACI